MPSVETPAKAVQPPPDAATPSEEQGGDTGEEFGTQLSQPETAEPVAEPESESSSETAADEDEIEFTRTGFAEMEAAAAGQGAPVAADGDQSGIEFEFGEQEAGTAPPEVHDLSAQTVRIEVPPEEVAPVIPPDEEPAQEAQQGEPDEVVEAQPIDAAEEEPTEVEPTEEAAESKKAEFKDESSMADTSPVEPPAEESTAPVEPPAESAGLSDADIDRIARRVLELAADRLDQIAWEVVPDMAEIVVRQRVRELEAEAEGPATESVQ
jgi:hypothetical protein